MSDFYDDDCYYDNEKLIDEENDPYDYSSIYEYHGYSSGFTSCIGPSLADEENLFYDDDY